MDIIEKVLGIAAVLVILAVFLVIIFVGVAYMQRWLEKGVNPSKPFPRNPNGGNLTAEQQRALNVGAILAANNRDFCDSLQTGKPSVMKTVGEMMKRDWGIASSKQASEQLEALKINGQRQIGSFILKNAVKFLNNGVPDPAAIFEMTGFSLLDKRILTEYPEEVALAEKNIGLMDAILSAESDEDVKKYEELFGGEKMFGRCINIYYHFYESCITCVQRTANLAQTIKLLQEKGFIGTELSELEKVDITAWDMGRMVNVARYCSDLGYISDSTAWEYIYFAEKESALRYSDWSEFARAYVIGRAVWGGENNNLYVTIDNVKKLKEDPKSPWALASLNK